MYGKASSQVSPVELTGYCHYCNSLQVMGVSTEVAVP